MQRMKGNNYVIRIAVILCSAFATLCVEQRTKCHPFKANTKDNTTYMRYVNDGWGVYPCAPGTVWNEEMCVCSNKPTMTCKRVDDGENTEASEPKGESVDVKKLTATCRKKHANLVWSVRLCQCVWKRKPRNMDPEYDPVNCEIVLHMQFDKNPPTDTNNFFVQPSNPELIEVVSDYGANDWVAIYLPEAPLYVPGLNGNDLSHSFRVSVRFRVDSIPYLENKFQLVFGNGCPEHPALLSLLYRAVDQTYRVRYVNSLGQHVVSQCVYVAGSAFSWKAVVLVLQDGLLHLFVNNKPCGAARPADVEKMGRFKCPFTVGGGEVLEGDGPFVGFFDNLIMVRRCKVPLPDY